ncbi:LacI family DNA-binding transcriptional regulator [Adhaeretor mobilis]|uniref:HTH-type transcriptional regulator DegA n=1 Tax=Adhaeretor mobilis TaxID=1930276 RepID=A0A517MYG6_9BACT|nr:LacI family DNA-binding transcriptional regulator [Adhaeretor mobilis]QDS99906.1 HTH-type transcriptional regulator DegA [Adhaeretor mobilis]
MATIRQVAKHAGVSIATVSRVINNSPAVTDEVRAKVLESVNSCGYVPNVGRRTTSFIALVYSGPSSLGSPYDAALLEGMVQAMDLTDLDLVILNPSRDKRPDESYTQFFLRKGVRGAILRSTVEGRQICRTIADEKFPAMGIGDHFEHPTLAFAYADSKTTSRQAIEHLITLGHQRIAFAANEHEDGDHVDRYAAYCEALDGAGIGIDRSIVYRVPARRVNGAQLLRNVMSVPKPPTAIYVTDPPIAMGLINEARNLGMDIPRDLSVVGFDDNDSRNFVFPKMTAVCQDARQLGHEAFIELARAIEAGNGERCQHRISSSWFEINNSTGPPPVKSVGILPDGTRLEAVGP